MSDQSVTDSNEVELDANCFSAQSALKIHLWSDLPAIDVLEFASDQTQVRSLVSPEYLVPSAENMCVFKWFTWQIA